MSEVADLIADLISAGVDPVLVGRVAQSFANSVDRPTFIQRERAKHGYTPDFDAFWKAYPRDANMSKFEAWQQWQKISPQERELAMKAVEPFKQWLKAEQSRKPDYRPVHACRFLSKKRFEGHAATPDLKVVASNPGVHIMKDSPEWSRYAEAYRAQKGKYPPVDQRGGWTFLEASGE